MTMLRFLLLLLLGVSTAEDEFWEDMTDCNHCDADAYAMRILPCIDLESTRWTVSQHNGLKISFTYQQYGIINCLAYRTTVP